MKKCTNCGYQNGDNEKICANCGARLEETSGTENRIESNLRDGIRKRNFVIAGLFVCCFTLLFILLTVAANAKFDGVSQETYNREKEKNEELKKKLEELSLEKDKIQDEYEEYKAQFGGYEEYADKIKNYGEIAKMEEEKEQLKIEIQTLTAQLDELKENMKNAKNPETDSDFLVYSDEKVEIYFSEVTSKGVVFEVKNLTDINLTFQADSVAINGISTNDIVMSDDVAPKSVGKIIARCSDFSVSETVYTVSGQMRVIDFYDPSWESYNIKFVNVEAK